MQRTIRTSRTVGVWRAGMRVTSHCFLAVESWLAGGAGMRAGIWLVLSGRAGDRMGRSSSAEMTLKKMENDKSQDVFCYFLIHLCVGSINRFKL